jgi:ferric enterobactin receptor
MSSSYHYKNHVSGFLVFLFILFAVDVISQEQFEFNKYGNPCYFKYLVYSPIKIYEDYNRPIIIILGLPGQDAATTFKEDTLKNLPTFSNYLFVYVPNRGQTPREKLGCLFALGHLLSFDYNIASINTFLQIKDSTIRQKDVQDNMLMDAYKAVRLYEKKPVKLDSAIIKNDVTLVFKENQVPVQEDDGAAYYYDNVEVQKQENQDFQQFKTYDGPPKSFNFTLSGMIKDRKTGEALPFSTVQILGTTYGASANIDGYFTLLKVPTDTSTLVVQYMGYSKRKVFLDPSSPKRNLIIEMNPEIQTLKTFTVIGKREDVILSDKSSSSLVKMTPRKLEQLPSIGEKDVMRSFQLMPGISSSMESSSGLYVRGGTPDQNLILYDGFTVYHVDHLYGFFSAFNANALKDVQLYKGGFDSKFGGRLSSVMEITGKDGNQNKMNCGADLSLLSVNAFAEIPVGKKITSVIAFRRSYKGDLYNKIFDKFNKSQTTSGDDEPSGGSRRRFSQDTKVTSYFYDVNGKFTYRTGDKDIISLSIFNGTDKLDNGFSANTPSFGPGNVNFNMNSTDLTKYGNIGSSLKWSRKWNSKLYGNTIISYSNYYSLRNRSQERTEIDSLGQSVTTNNGVFEDNNLKDYSLKSDYQLDILKFCQLQFGSFYTLYDIKYSYAQSDTSKILDRDDHSVVGGLYVQSKTSLLKDKLEFLPGIRMSHFGPTSSFYSEPRVSFNCHFNDQLSVKAATGKYYQFANRVTREDIMSGSKDFWILSDGKNVPVSSATHYSAGISYENNSYLLSAEFYYKKITGLTEYSLRFNSSPDGVSYEENFYSGYGYSKGIELLLQKKSGKVNGWVSYTLGEAKNHFDIYSDSYYPANQDIKHEFKVVGLYKYKRWDFSATWVYATGRHYTAPSGAYYITLLDGTTQEFFTVTEKNGLQLPDYHRLDVSANFKILGGIKGDKKRREFGYIGFSIFNLYNRQNVWYKQYSIEDGGIIETSIKYLGFIPNLTLSLKLR